MFKYLFKKPVFARAGGYWEMLRWGEWMLSCSFCMPSAGWFTSIAAREIKFNASSHF